MAHSAHGSNLEHEKAGDRRELTDDASLLATQDFLKYSACVVPLSGAMQDQATDYSRETVAFSGTQRLGFAFWPSLRHVASTTPALRLYP